MARNPRGVVQWAQFKAMMDRYEENLKDDMGRKFSEWGRMYYHSFLAPLEERISWLELPWYKKAWYTLVDWGQRLKVWWKTRGSRKDVETIPAPEDASEERAVEEDAAEEVVVG